MVSWADDLKNMNKVIKIGVEARDELAKGADFLANAVKSTLGPFGQNFFIDKKNSITNDGVTVAREIQLVDEVQNRGATALREAATKTNDEAGDGTTTAVVLAQAIYQAASRYLSKENTIGKKTPSEIIRRIEQERVEVTEKLVAMATPIDSVEALVKSAIVSVEDPDLGKLIGEAQWDLGPNGFLIAEPTAEVTCSIEKVRGIRIDNGFGTSAVTNNQEKGALELEDLPVILTSITMRSIEEWKPFMDRMIEPLAKQGKRSVVVIARAWTDETIKFCMANHEAGMSIYPLSAPYINMNERMKDLAAVTGAFYYDSEHSNIDDMMLSGIGHVNKIVATRNDAIITGTNKTEELVTKRIDDLEKELSGEPSVFAKNQLRERISQLKNGFAIVKVGSASDMERQRLFAKCEDAVNAVRAALQEGTVPGGGLAYKQIAESLPSDYLLKRPLMAPYEQIMSSAPEGFTIEEWVRDPLKVMRVALEKACIAASSFATAGGVITDEKPKDLDQLLRRAVAPQE